MRRLAVFAVPAVCLSLAEPAAAQPLRSAVLFGWIKDSSGTPVSRADVAIEAQRAATRTDSAGRFVLAALEPGNAMIRIRRLGFDPQTFEFMLQASRTDSVSVTLEQSAKLIEAMRTDATLQKRFTMIDEFYRRRSKGSGSFVTRDDLARNNAVVLSEALRQVPGLRVVRTRAGGGGLRFPSSGSKSYDCAPQYWVDGRRVRGVEIDDFPVEDIEGIELYSGASTTPVQFTQGSVVACGTVVIWTRIPGVPHNFH